MENMHYDALYEKRKALLPTVIKHDLTQRQRQVVLLYYVKKQTIQQIADTMHISPNAVYRLRERAEARIAHYLGYCS